MFDIENFPELDDANQTLFETLWPFLDQPKARRGAQPLEIIMIRKLYGVYRYEARIRKLDWHLTETEFVHLILSPCHYCMSPCCNLSRKQGHSIQYNGIDRYDNTIGYVPNNCVPSCFRCNAAKRAIPPEHWEQWLDRVAARTLERRTR